MSTTAELREQYQNFRAFFDTHCIMSTYLFNKDESILNRDSLWSMQGRKPK